MFEALFYPICSELTVISKINLVQLLCNEDIAYVNHI